MASARNEAAARRRSGVRPGKAYDLTVHLWPVHHRLAAGHHLEITVASDDHPEIDSDAPAGQVRITNGTLEIGSAPA